MVHQPSTLTGLCHTDALLLRCDNCISISWNSLLSYCSHWPSLLACPVSTQLLKYVTNYCLMSVPVDIGARNNACIENGDSSFDVVCRH